MGSYGLWPTDERIADSSSRWQAGAQGR